MVKNGNAFCEGRGELDLDDSWWICCKHWANVNYTCMQCNMKIIVINRNTRAPVVVHGSYDCGKQWVTSLRLPKDVGLLIQPFTCMIYKNLYLSYSFTSTYHIISYHEIPRFYPFNTWFLLLRARSFALLDCEFYSMDPISNFPRLTLWPPWSCKWWQIVLVSTNRT